MDLPNIDKDFGEIYKKGVENGIKQAETYDHVSDYEAGVVYGRQVTDISLQWGLECGYQQGFIDILKKKMAQSDSSILKNSKLKQMLGQISHLLEITTLDKCTVEEINDARALIGKKFRMMLALLKVKHHANPIPEETLDF